MKHFCLVLTGIANLTEEMINALFESGCDDSTPCFIDKEVRIWFDREAESLEDAISMAIRDVRQANIGGTLTTIEIERENPNEAE